MRKDDPKLAFGGGFANPEVQEILLRELRALKTSEAVWQLPSFSDIEPRPVPTQTSGLIEWYRRIGHTRNA